MDPDDWTETRVGGRADAVMGNTSMDSPEADRAMPLIGVFNRAAAQSALLGYPPGWPN